MTCSECPTPLGRYNKTGLCRLCGFRRAAAARKLPRKNCQDCDKVLSLGNSSGRCHPCFNKSLWAEASEDFRTKHRAGIQRKFEDPEYRAKNIKACRRTSQKSALDPAIQAKRRENWFRVYNNVLNTPEMRAKNRAAVKAKSGKTTSANRLAWCPEEMRDRYRYLVRTKRMLSEVAKEVVEKEWADITAVRSGNLDGATAWLQRISYVQRCDEQGKPNPFGAYYRFGSAVLSPGEVVARATATGWKPIEWRVAA